MSYCLNPNCPNPQNTDAPIFCVTCGTKLLLRERYRAIKPLGQGGFGRTFLAVDEDKPSKPRCVIKQFFPLVQTSSSAQKAAELFTLEAVQLDELGKHPQIPDLLAYFIQDNRQYLVQEFIDGQTLTQELAEKGTFNETQIRELLNDLLPVLQFVHNHQVIHRDIKPDNIIIRKIDKKLFLVDFGASKTATAAALQQTGTTIGSPEYVSPEQSRGRAVFSSDIYSLGVTCINLLTGISPFDLYDMREDVWIWRQFVKNSLSNKMVKILDKMLENATNRRYQSAAEVLQDLQFQPSVTPSKPPVKYPLPPPPPIVNPVVKPVINPPINLPINPVVKPSNPGSKSQVDKELEELRSQFLGTGTSQSKIDLELEEIKSQFDPKSPKNKPGA